MRSSDALSSPVDACGFAQVVGLEVGSRSLLSTVLQPDKRPVKKPTELTNRQTGFGQLHAALSQLGVPAQRILMGLEATSRYSEPLYQFLAAQGYTLCLLHPRQTHPFAEQRGLRAKTDQMSATPIARLLLSGEARPGYVPDELITTAREMERLHSQLADESARSQNQIQARLFVLFPEFVQVFADPCRPTALALLSRYPSAKAITAAGVEVITATLRELARGRSGRPTAQQLVALASHSAASGLASEARALSLQILCDQLQHPLANLARLEQELDQLLDRDTGASGLKSPPEFGRKTVAVLRAALGDVSRYEPRRSGRSVCGPGPGGQAERPVERPGQALQTWQRASAARALSGGLALDLLAGVGLRCLLPAPGRPWPPSP